MNQHNKQLFNTEVLKATVTHGNKDSLRNYKRYLLEFYESLKDNLEKYTEPEYASFLSMIQGKYSVRVSNYIKTLTKKQVRRYVKNYSDKFRDIDDYTRAVRPEPAYSSDQMLTIGDIELLVQGEESKLWKCYWMVYFYGGFRPKEACELTWKQVTFEPDGTAFVNVFVGKNRKQFIKVLPSNAVHYLKLLPQDNEHVFKSRQGKGHIMPSTVRWRLARLSKKVLGEQVNPYRLRHSIATIIYNKDMDGDDVAQQMGHSKDMKKVYTHNSIETIKARAKKLWIEPENKPFVQTPTDKKKLDALMEALELLSYAKLQMPKGKLEALRQKLKEANE